MDLFPTSAYDQHSSESDLRQVPNTQEVLLYPDSGKSIILEVLKKVEPTGAEDAARYAHSGGTSRIKLTPGGCRFHFDSIAHDSDAEAKNVLDVRVVPNDRGDQMPSVIVLDGTQTVKKFNASVPDQVRIFMALYRIEDKDVDLVLVMNVPIISQDGGAISGQDISIAQKEFETAALSLRIIDFGLFV